MRMRWMSVVLCASCLTMACAVRTPTAVVVPVASTTPQHTAVFVAADKAVAGIELVGVLVRDSYRVAQQLEREHMITSAQYDDIRRTIARVTPTVQAALTSIQAATHATQITSATTTMVTVVDQISAVLRATQHAKLMAMASTLETVVRAIGQEA
jgi:hypothetical protein